MSSTFTADMPKDPKKLSAQAHLETGDYNEFKELADKKRWSVKRLNEALILWFIKEVKKNPKKLDEIK